LAVDWVRERWHGRAGSDELEHLHKDYVRAFQAHTTDALDDPKMVLAHPEIPKKGDPYQVAAGSDPDALCIRRRAVNDSDNPQLFEVICDYSTRQPEEDEPGDNPLLRPAEITGDTELVQKALEWAHARELFTPTTDPIDGTLIEGDPKVAIVNTAYQPFEPPPTIEHEVDILTITKNLALTVNELQALRLTFRRKTNKLALLGYEPHCVRVGAITWSNAREKGIKFKRASLRLLFSPDGFFYEPLNAGYWELVSGTLKQIVEHNGQTPSVPQHLSQSGQKFTPTTLFEPIYCRFQIYEQEELAPLLTLFGFEQ
jgi:hypothetical protein